ncbi:hypothetical protein EVAR_16247_1 [Eumeta japonica]|uniref:Uncharacterized protein n=1 Tax=Eumeta variegata TaxID=151549 RepID=A0A4C1U600_EUMVA|nr:hypothetical protein EVAR_16247_1 [Eumeta japonica]
MKQYLALVLVLLFQYVSCERELCGNQSSVNNMRSCSSQILGHDSNFDTCLVEFFPPNSAECKDMNFGPIVDNKNIGGVSLKPYIWPYHYEDAFKMYRENYTVLNITFTNIKWKRSSVHIKDWKPFTYIEIHTSTLKLHILPPPSHIKIEGYRIEVMKACDKRTQCEETAANTTIKVKNSTKEVTYQYSLLRNVGSYYFLVTPLHEACATGTVECQSVRSPIIYISSDVPETTYICIASLTSLVVAILFAYYVALRVIRRYWCKDYRLAPGKESAIPPPPKILVIYSPANKVHAECVNSFVNYLRFECGLDIMYDGDIAATAHGDPYVWADEAFKVSNYVLYIISPAEETNTYHNIYDQPIITPHRNIDTLQLNLLKANRATKNPKHVANIVFEHSDISTIPMETKNDKVFYLLKDWQKLIAYLSKNLLTKQQMMRTEKGRCFLEDLKRAKKLLNNRNGEIIIKCENIKLQSVEKKVLL